MRPRTRTRLRPDVTVSWPGPPAPLRPDRTVLLVTHQADALSAMDEILVLDAGKLVEQGTLPQLLDKRGLFYEMWKWQQDLLDWSVSAGKETK